MIEDRLKIQYDLIRTLPEEIIEAFRQEAGGWCDIVRTVKSSQIKLVAMDSSRIVGFVSANYFNNGVGDRKDKDLISVHGFYVAPAYRRRGVGKFLLYCTIMKAKRENLGGVDIDDMLWPSVHVLERITEKCKNNPWLTIDILHGEEAIYGEIIFKDLSERIIYNSL